MVVYAALPTLFVLFTQEVLKGYVGTAVDSVRHKGGWFSSNGFEPSFKKGIILNLCA